MPKGIFIRTKAHNEAIGRGHLGKSSGMLGKVARNKGVPHTDVAKKKMSKARKGVKRAPFTDITKRKIGEASRIRNLGEKSHFWKGGISDYPYPEEWTTFLRESIRIRDNYICQECGVHQDELIGRLKRLDVHHIDYNKDNCNPSNLITLCRGCHVKTNSNREYWADCFTKRGL